MTSRDGLWLFLAVQILNVNALIIDYALLKLGFATVTEFAQRHEWFAAIVICLNVLGVIGLVYHLYPKLGGAA